MKHLRIVLLVVGVLLGAICFGQLSSRPNFTFQRGINLTPDAPEFVQGSTVAWLKSVGLDHACLCTDIERGEVIMGPMMDLAKRLQAQGTGVIIRPFYSGSSVAAISQWWSLMLKYSRGLIVSGTQYAILNEPVSQVGTSPQRWTQFDWLNSIQPKLYELIRGLAPQNQIIVSPGGIASWEAFQDSQAGNMWLPPDTSLVSVDLHAYILAQDGTWDNLTANVPAIIAAFAARRHVRIQCTEFGGGEEASVSWATVLQRVNQRVKIFAANGWGWSLWHWARLETFAHAIRYDMLLALFGPTYSPPANASLSGVGPAGSTPAVFAPATVVHAGGN